jgi:hypothetical protein
MINLVEEALRVRITELYLESKVSSLLEIALEKGKEKRELVDTCGLRNIGKTRKLIEFAKENGYGVFVLRNAKLAKSEYNYDLIFDSLQANSARGTIKDIVIDEGVSAEWLRDDFNIITGYYASWTKNVELKNIDDQVKVNLSEELRKLGQKLEKHREKEDFTTYKNLIVAYKEVYDLYSKIAKPQDNLIINNVVNVDDTKKVKDILKEIEIQRKKLVSLSLT